MVASIVASNDVQPQKMQPQSPAPGGQPPQPPFGASPVTGPTPNRGYEAAAAQKLGLIVKQLTEVLSLAGVGSDVGKEVLKALNSLAKLVPSGSVSPAAEKNNIESMAMKNAQGNQQMQALKQQMMGGQAGAPPGGAPPGAAPPQMPRAA